MGPSKASAFIRSIHTAAQSELPFDDTRDDENAQRGFLGRPEHIVVRNSDGDVVWDNDSYAFLSTDEPPDTVHPSLWRQSKLTAIGGLFEVVPGIYQVRGFDISHITFIEGREGIVIIDPLTTREPAAAALELYREHRGDRPVTGVIYTHSHIDHFGGVLGVVAQEAVDQGGIRVIAPEGFTEHAIAENVYAGTAMGRRAGYMYGAALDRSPWGQVGSGLGQVPSTGSAGIVMPTDFITETGQILTVDGIEMEYQLAPGSEAPAEMHIFFPRHEALCLAENATHTLHNLLTLRGAVVRDPHAWAGYLTEAIDLFAQRTQVLFSPHHWPTWGRSDVLQHISLQRDLYAYLHDQTIRLINKGYQGAEIAEMLQLPPVLERAWHARGYYGSVSHNVKAIYQRYMGWFDGHPARLWPHPPAELARRYVEAIGGMDRVIDRARSAYESGDYRWAATLLDHAVFTDPEHVEARGLLADTLEQLAFGSENATWRNVFLSGASELRGVTLGTPTQPDSPGLLAQLTPSQLFDAIAIRVEGPKAWDENFSFEIQLLDAGETYHLCLRHGVLIHRAGSAADPDVDVRLSVESTPRLIALLNGDDSSPGLTIDGDHGAISRLFGVLDDPDPGFNIVLP